MPQAGSNRPRMTNTIDLEDEKTFFERLYDFMSQRGSPIQKLPIFDHKELDLYQLYKGVISRGGLENVIEHKLWRQITTELCVDPERTDAGFRLRIHYLKYLYPYERKYFMGASDDDFDYDTFEKQISKSTSGANIMNMRADRITRSMPPRQKKNRPKLRSVSDSRPREAHDRAREGPDEKLPKSDSKEGSPETSPNSNRAKRPISDCMTSNLRLLDVMTLKRYKKHHQIRVAGVSKKELSEAITMHFLDQKIDEDVAISAFVAHVKGLKSMPENGDQVKSVKVAEERESA